MPDLSRLLAAGLLALHAMLPAAESPSGAWTAVAGPDWLALPPRTTDIVPGSILDFSDLVEPGPAGRHGFVVATPDGHLAYADRPGTPLRLFGANVNFGMAFPDAADADRLADTLWRMGYNAVRLHHIDQMLLRSGDGVHSWDIDPERLDRLERFIAALRARGIHLAIDLWSCRSFAADESELGIPFGKEFKVLAAISPLAQESWRRFARSLLLHRNPHTGLTWAEDPAIASICPVNEDSLFVWHDRFPAVKALLDARFAAWSSAHPEAGEGSAAYSRFLTALQEESRSRLTAFLRDDLGIKALITGVNHRNTPQVAEVRANLALVEQHGYWDHPHFPERPWSLPYTFTQRSLVLEAAKFPRAWMGARVPGLPFQFTEYNAVYPNRFRAEGGVVMGAYAAQQGWDGLYRFIWGLSTDVPPDVVHAGAITGFRIDYDPVALLGERIAAAFFARHDVAQATGSVIYLVGAQDHASPPSSWPQGGLSQDFQAVGLRRLISSLPVAAVERLRQGNAVLTGLAKTQRELPAWAQARFVDLKALPERSLKGAIASEAGDISLDPDAGSFAVSTAGSAALVLTKGGTGAAGPLRVAAADDQPCTVGVVARQGGGLESSPRLLLLHLTDAVNSGMQCDTPERLRVTVWGDLPVLVRRASAAIRLVLPERRWTVHAVDLSGRRLQPVPSQWMAGELTFTADSAGAGQPVLAYEIVAE